jgi:uncharacterized protein YkwD
MNDAWPARRRGLRLSIVLVFTLALLFALPVAAQAVSYSTEELEFLRLINEYRQNNGLAKLLLSDQVSDAAEKHSGDMAKYKWFSHNTQVSDYYPAGSTPWYRMAQSGYSAGHMGENLAGGQSTAASALSAWKASPPHDAVMLVPEFKVIGIGLVHLPGSPFGYYWTTDFGSFVDASAHDPFTSAPPTTTTTAAPATKTTAAPTTTTAAPTITTTAPASLVPTSPYGLQVGRVTANSATLKWRDGSANERGFVLERSQDGRAWSTLALFRARAGTGGAFNYTNHSLARATTYYYRVKAYNEFGQSAPSNAVLVRTR